MWAKRGAHGRRPRAHPRAKTFKKATVSEKVFFVTGMPAEMKCYKLPARPMQSNKTILGFTSVLEKKLTVLLMSSLLLATVRWTNTFVQHDTSRAAPGYEFCQCLVDDK